MRSYLVAGRQGEIGEREHVGDPVLEEPPDRELGGQSGPELSVSAQHVGALDNLGLRAAGDLAAVPVDRHAQLVALALAVVPQAALPVGSLDHLSLPGGPTRYQRRPYAA
jgi:hypothetical protein